MGSAVAFLLEQCEPRVGLRRKRLFAFRQVKEIGIRIEAGKGAEQAWMKAFRAIGGIRVTQPGGRVQSMVLQIKCGTANKGCIDTQALGIPSDFFERRGMGLHEDNRCITPAQSFESHDSRTGTGIDKAMPRQWPNQVENRLPDHGAGGP